MRILQIAPLWERVPPPGYGGTEAVVSILTEELVRQGHDVTLAASGDSMTSANLTSVFAHSLRTANNLVDRSPYDWVHVGSALAQAPAFDIVHNHAGELVMAMAGAVQTPMLTTMHCLMTPDTQFVWNRYAGSYNTISNAQQYALPPIAGPARFMGHVYNAIDVDSFPFDADKEDYLLFLSRISPEKGPHLAIEVARRTGRRLLIAGKVDRVDERFFEEVVKDSIDGDQIVFVGEANAEEKRRLYRKAAGVLMPLTWEEPFGLVMTEAMACGTPVIALRRGSAPELIRHNETGFVVDTVAEMADAVSALPSIDPHRCRQHVADNFSPHIMAANYLGLYEELLRTGTGSGPSLARRLPAPVGRSPVAAASASPS
jgi:glycosyltransferase involved in cell wall biosynthesis